MWAECSVCGVLSQPWLTAKSHARGCGKGGTDAQRPGNAVAAAPGDRDLCSARQFVCGGGMIGLRDRYGDECGLGAAGVVDVLALLQSGLSHRVQLCECSALHIPTHPPPFAQAMALTKLHHLYFTLLLEHHHSTAIAWQCSCVPPLARWPAGRSAAPVHVVAA